MTGPEVASTPPEDPAAPRASWRDSLAVYLQRRVLIVLLLGFSSGLPLALSGSTLLVWMRESGVDLGTIGLFALVGTPYTLKFLWAPLTDALHVPLFTRAFGRRRGWLLCSQLFLIVSILLLALTDPARFTRVGHLLPFALPGGDGAVRQPARIALDLLSRADVEWTDDLPPVAALDENSLHILRQQIPRGLGCAATTSMGRLFDAVASLLGVCQQVTYEGQAAIEL